MTEHEDRAESPSGSAEPSAGAPRPDPPGHATLKPGEFAQVCSHYDLGRIIGAKAYLAGSRKSPKAIIESTAGKFLLKRRAPGKDNPRRVAMNHGMQLHLQAHGLAIARLVGTKRTNASMVTMGQCVYEMFEYVDGERYDRSLEATEDSGRTLAEYHRVLAGFTPPRASPTRSYHNADRLATVLPYWSERLAGARGRQTAERLATIYDVAVRKVEDENYGSWPLLAVHGDWHPGNVLFRDRKVIAVLDFEDARVGPRMIDMAAAAMNFSIRAPGKDVSHWPAEPDEDRLRAFIKGYDEVEGCRLSVAEVRALPWLMAEAFIVKTAVQLEDRQRILSIGATAFLEMTERKSAWLRDHAERLSRSIMLGAPRFLSVALPSSGPRAGAGAGQPQPGMPRPGAHQVVRGGDE